MEMEAKYRGLISILLSCGLNNVDTIADISGNIISEAIETLNGEGIDINFPSLYQECAEIALAQEGIRGEIDSNYRCGCITISKRDYKSTEVLEAFGFSIEEVSE